MVARNLFLLFLDFTPGPALVLLSKICTLFSWSLFKFFSPSLCLRFDTHHIQSRKHLRQNEVEVPNSEDRLESHAWDVPEGSDCLRCPQQPRSGPQGKGWQYTFSNLTPIYYPKTRLNLIQDFPKDDDLDESDDLMAERPRVDELGAMATGEEYRESLLQRFWVKTCVPSYVYRDRPKSWCVVARSLFLLLLTCFAWPCLGPVH